MFKFITLAILLPLFVSGQNPRIPLPPGFKNHVTDTTPPFVVLPKLRTFVFDKTSKNATLSAGEITAIRRLVKQKLKKQGTEGIKFERYKMQLIPSINKSGEKVVFVNGFCATPSNWLVEFVLVKDGGECYYQATINLRKRRFLSFSFNGEA
jgi:hypothetical protein